MLPGNLDMASRLFGGLLFFVTQCNGQTSSVSPSASLPFSNASPPVVTSSPSTSASVITPNSEVLQVRGQTTAGICGCDLTPSPVCSPNCCCDTDCTVMDIAVFSTCVDAVNRTDDSVCISEHIIATSNVVYKTETTNNPSLFCIYTDNNPGRRQFATPDLITSNADFDSRVSQFSSPSYKLEQAKANLPGQFYRFGDPIVTISPSDLQAHFSLPVALDNTDCRDRSVTEFLNNEVSECIRVVSDLASDCETLAALDAMPYFDGFRIAKLPLWERPPTINESHSIFNSSQAIPITVSHPVSCIVAEHPRITRECEFNRTVPHPTYNNLTKQCENVAREVSYTITHNATKGIVSASVLLTLGSVSQSSLPLLQKYQVTFHKINPFNVSSYQRSGNPGYIVGKPVIAGRKVTSETEASQIIEINPDPLSWLTVISLAPPLGDCLEIEGRRSVLFGEDLRTGCVMRVTFDNITRSCLFLRSLAITRLRGSDLPTHVAVFGNPDLSNLADWVPVLTDPPPATQVVNPGSGVCPDVPVNVHLEVLYALTGDFTDPQSKIVGARFSYVTQNIQFRCTMPFCQSQFSEKTQLVEFSSSVAFIDVSSRPEQLLKPPFRVSTELPADFFYPFFSGGRSGVCLAWTWLVVGVGINAVLQTCC